MASRAIAIVALGAGAAALAGCGGSSSSGSKSAGSGGATVQTFTITETEYKLSPATITIAKPGRYTFKAMNGGTISHALEIEGQGVEAKTAPIQSGSSAEVTVNLTKTGSYNYYCPIDGHRKLGMQGLVRVGSAGGGATTQQSSTTSGGGYGY